MKSPGERANEWVKLWQLLLLVAAVAAACSSNPGSLDSASGDDIGTETQAPAIRAGSVSCSLAGELVVLEFGPTEPYVDEADARAVCEGLSDSEGPQPLPTTTTTTIPERAPEELTLPQLVQQVSSGVVRIVANTCGSEGTGTGFLIGERHIATAAHVVEDAELIEVEVDSVTREARVIGFNNEVDLALLETSVDLSGHIFSLDSAAPPSGAEVIAVGFPGTGEGQQIVTTGIVSARHARTPWSGVDYLQTDTAINPGNSGGPLLQPDGSLAGVIQRKWSEAGIEGAGYAAVIEESEPFFTEWLQAPSPVPSATCRVEQPTVDSVGYIGVVDVRTSHFNAPEIAEGLNAYMEGINFGETELAWERLAPELRDTLVFEDFAQETSTSFNVGITLWSVQDLDVNETKAEVTFTSFQDAEYGPNGETCTAWTIEYDFFWQGTFGWRIAGARNLGQSPEGCI